MPMGTTQSMHFRRYTAQAAKTGNSPNKPIHSEHLMHLLHLPTILGLCLTFCLDGIATALEGL